MKNAFSINKEEPTIPKFKNKYLIIYTPNSRVFYGKMTETTHDGFAILNPFIGIFGKQGQIIKKIIYLDSPINISDIMCIEPATKKTLEIICDLENKRMSDVMQRTDSATKKEEYLLR